MYVLATETLEDGTIKITYGDQYGNIVGYGYYTPLTVDDPGAQTSDFPVLTSVFEEWTEHDYIFGTSEPTSDQGDVGNYYLRTNNVNPGLWSWYGPKNDTETPWPLLGTTADKSRIINGDPYGDCSNGKDILWRTLDQKVFDNYNPAGKNSRTLVRYDQATDTWIQSKGDFVLSTRGGGHGVTFSPAVSNPSSTLPYTLDVQYGTYHDVTLVGNSYINIGVPTVDYETQAASFYVLVRQDGTGGRALNWSNFMTVNWAGGAAPAFPQDPDAWMLFNFISFNNGASYTAYALADSVNDYTLSLDQLADVSAPSPSNGEALVWNGTSWVNSTVTASVAALDDVGDVTAPTPTSGDFLKWNGTAWVNDAIDLGTDTTGNYVADVTAGTGITVTHTPGEASSAAVALNAALDNLSDVVITTPNEFDVLEYDGTNWVNKHASVVTRVKNAEATTLNIGEVVYIFGASGDMATVKRADNDSDATSAKTLGIVATSMAPNNEGTVVTRGYVDGIDLSTGYTAGDILWLGEDGGFTKTKPTTPEHLVFIGVVCRTNANGIIYVAVQNGYEIDELHNVAIDGGTLANNDLLQYNSSNEQWENIAPATVAGDMLLDNIGNVTAPSPSSGDFLKWNGSAWVNDSIDLGTDTTGNYVADVAAGTNISVTHTPGEGSTPTVNLNVTSTTSADTAGVRLITHSTSDPTGGADGDVWLKYTP